MTDQRLLSGDAERTDAEREERRAIRESRRRCGHLWQFGQRRRHCFLCDKVQEWNPIVKLWTTRAACKRMRDRAR